MFLHSHTFSFSYSLLQIKTIVEDSDVASFTFLRFALASLIALPYLPGLSTIISKNPSNTSNHLVGQTKDDDDKNKNITMASSEVATAWRWGLEVRCLLLFFFLPRSMINDPLFV